MKALRLLACFFTSLPAFGIEIGNDPNGGGGLDGWSSIMVIDEFATYTNTSGADELVTPVGFDFQVGSRRGRVTPFLVKVNGNDNFTVLAIGRTRVSGSDYSSTGVFEYDFGNSPAAITLGPGETLAAGMTNANANGSGNGGSVIPFNNGGNQIWLTGGSASSQTGSLVVGEAPGTGASTLNLNRVYAYSIDVTVTPARNDPPTNILYSGGQPLPGMAIGTTLGSFSSVDPDAADSHRYTLVSNPGSRYNLNDNELRMASPPGATGSSSTIRIRSTDSQGNSFEKDFTLTVESQSAPTALSLDATSINALASQGAPVSEITATDANAGDQFTYSLVPGRGDEDNALFSINGNVLTLASSIPGNQAIANFRLRVVDLGGNAFEESFSLPILEPSVQINEFAASNNSLTDEDGDTPDWIELYNAGSSEVDLANWTISDDPNSPAKWTFPSYNLPPGAYLVLFASGKNRAVAGSELHTNFSLSTRGETLTLSAPGGNQVSRFLSPPDQYPNISYGLDPVDDREGYLTPTPNTRNGTTFEEVSDKVDFSHLRGSYSAPFQLTLSSPGNTQIRYTTNGSPPTASSPLYTAPITVSPPTSGRTAGIRTIRAAAFGGSALLRPIATHTYLFVDQAVNQSTFTSSIANHPVYRPLLDDALLAHPVISITKTGGLPNGNESETSLEYFDPENPGDRFQIDCGIKVVGGHSIGSSKNNFRLYFRGDYGQTKLVHPIFAGHPYSTGATDTFDRLNLRSGSHDTFFWLSNPNNPPNSGGPVKGDSQYFRNRWISDMQFRMGQPAMHGRWVQVFINGNYHGQYHLLEHPNEEFQADYFGGFGDDYEFTNGANASKTGSDNWQTIWPLVKTASNRAADLADDWIDLENLCDYMILNFYAGNPWDWNPNQNWWAGGPNQPNRGGWKFYAWDSDIIFQDPGANVLGKQVPDGIFHNLINDPDFAIIFRDRLYQHCFHDGALSPAQVREAFDYRAAEIETSIVAETARWQGAAANSPWDRDGEWDAELTRMRTTFFPNRCTTLMNQIRARGWYPVETPEYSQRGGSVPSGYQPNLTAPAGTIYYTTDGSDPREPGGAVSPNALPFSPGSLTLTQPTLVRARALHSGDWSAINDAAFVIDGTLPADASNLALTEIHYHPSEPTNSEIAAGFTDDDDFEFLELTNTSNSPLDLTGVSFTLGVNFTFPASTVLAPGQRILVVRNTSAFLSRHPGLESSIAGEFSSPFGIPGDEKLSNDGERLLLLAADSTTIVDLTYNDQLPWPNEADGDGFTLILRDTTANPADPNQWRSSSTPDGNPAASDTIPYSGSDPVAYALANPNLVLTFSPTGKAELEYLANLGADQALITLQKSSDLVTWQEAGYEIEDRDNNGDGTISIRHQSPLPVIDQSLFFRLQVTIP
jgi:hypothetical protein